MTPATTANMAAHEFIGLKVRVSSSPDPTIIGLDGTVRNETKNTLTIEARGKLHIIPKEKSIFIFTLPTGETVSINGSAVGFRPEDRVKKGIL